MVIYRYQLTNIKLTVNVFEAVCGDFGVVCGGLRYFNGPVLFCSVE